MLALSMVVLLAISLEDSTRLLFWWPLLLMLCHRRPVLQGFLGMLLSFVRHAMSILFAVVGGGGRFAHGSDGSSVV